MKEMTNRLSVDLVLILWDVSILGRVLVKELLPLLLVTLNLVNDVLKEARWLVVELVFGKGHNVKPHLLVHPVELLVSVIDTGARFEEHVDITLVELT